MIHTLDTDISTTTPMLHALLRAPKGKNHIFYFEGSEDLSIRQVNKRKERLRRRIVNLRLPYSIHFFRGYAGVIGFWSFDDPLLIEEKGWFDMNANDGVYPEIINSRR